MVEDALTNVLSNSNRPDGILSAVESSSLCHYKVCKTLHIKIPDDIKLISFSNMNAVYFLVPSLTSVIQPDFEIGKAVA